MFILSGFGARGTVHGGHQRLGPHIRPVVVDEVDARLAVSLGECHGPADRNLHERRSQRGPPLVVDENQIRAVGPQTISHGFQTSWVGAAALHSACNSPRTTRPMRAVGASLSVFPHARHPRRSFLTPLPYRDSRNQDGFKWSLGSVMNQGLPLEHSGTNILMRPSLWGSRSPGGLTHRGSPVRADGRRRTALHFL